MALLLAGAAPAGAQPWTALPEAPQPRLGAGLSGDQVGDAVSQPRTVKVPGKPDPGKAGGVDTASLEARKWSRYVDPGEETPQLTRGDKMMYWMRDEVRWWSPLPAFLSAGFGQLTDGDPRYGVDTGAFGQRLGTALVRQASMRLLCDSVLPVMTGEDPRYFRKASGGYGGRIGWAAKQALLRAPGSGRPGLNVSDLVGHLAASALTLAYYPEKSRRGDVVWQTWLTSIAGNAGNNEFFEFWPDVMNLWKRHRARARGASGD